jgi:hypothetical protein
MDKFVIDTSSLLTLARYFIPFDNQSTLFNKLQDRFKAQEIILLDGVLQESKKVSKGLVTAVFSFLNKVSVVKNNQVITQKKHRILDNHYAVQLLKNKLNNSEYEQQKNNYIKSADYQLIFYAIANNNVTIITEESSSQNDNKLFKKIPIICKHHNVQCENIVFLLQQLGLKIDFSV